MIGHPKSGKSTLVREMVAAVLHKRLFLGMPVMPCRVVMLSEERDGSLSYAVAQHNIATGDLRLLQRHRVAGSPPWPDVIEAALDEVKRLGAELLIVDTLPFWSLGESDENSAADGMKAMEPLLRVAAEGVAVLSLRHMRKSGGDTVSAARGASSITGAADIVCTLSAHVAGDTFRVIDATGRFKESVVKTRDRADAVGLRRARQWTTGCAAGAACSREPRRLVAAKRRAIRAGRARHPRATREDVDADRAHEARRGVEGPLGCGCDRVQGSRDEQRPPKRYWAP